MVATLVMEYARMMVVLMAGTPQALLALVFSPSPSCDCACDLCHELWCPGRLLLSHCTDDGSPGWASCSSLVASPVGRNQPPPTQLCSLAEW